MLATQTPGASSRLLGPPAGELKFRIQGGEHHGRILRIAAAKCSIGSAPGCTLRLRGDGIEPLHCLILMGKNGTVVRRNSPRTYLNGGPFDDAVLQPGDLLRVGPIELVVAACPQATSGNPLPRVSEAAHETPSLLATKSEQPTPEQIDCVQEEARREQQRLASELSQMTEQLRIAQEQLAKAGRIHEQSVVEQQQTAEQLRVQYAQGLERFLNQQRLERAESLAREEHLQRELSQTQQCTAELKSRLAEAEAATERLREDHRRAMLQLQQELRAEQEQHQQERAGSTATQKELEREIALLRAEVDIGPNGQQPGDNSAGDRIRELQTALKDAERLGLQQLAAHQREREEFTLSRGRLEVSISILTEQLQKREAELTTAHVRGGECADTLTTALDNARRELRELQVLRSTEEETRTNFRMRLEEQLTDLTDRLIEREKELAQGECELQELRQRASHLNASGQMVEQLQESLAAAAAAHQTERETWLAERSALQSLQSEGETARLQLAAQQTALESQCSSLEAQRSEVATQLLELQNQHADLRARFDHLESQCGVLSSECGTLQSQCSSLEAQRSELETQVTTAQEAVRRCKELEDQLTSLRSAQELAVQAAQEQAAQQYEEQVERWQSEAHQSQLRCEEVAGELGELQRRCTELEAANVELKAAARAAEVAAGERQNFEVLRSQLEMQRKDLAEAQAQLQEEQTRLKQLLTETSAREETLARYEAELRERESAWETVRAEQSTLLEERSQLIASQIAQFEAEQVAFSRQQATIIQQMSTLEDRVHQLTTPLETHSTNSLFVIPRLDDPALMGDMERAEQPYVRATSSGTSEAAARLEDIQLPESPPDTLTAEEATSEPAADSRGNEMELVSSRLMAEGLWKESAQVPESVADAEVLEPAPEKPRYTPTSFLDQAAERVRQEELAGATVRAANTSAIPDSQNVRQPYRAASSAAKEEDDDSIEAYMSRLLSRVRGSDPPANAAPASQNPQPTAPASTSPSVPAEISETPSGPKEKDYVPRVHAPEPPERLSLMRALANTAAKSAIQAHARQSQRRETKRRSLVALLSLLGATSLFVAGFYTGSATALIGSLAFVAAFFFMTAQAISSSVRQMRLPPPGELNKQPETEMVAEPSEQH